MPYNTILNQVNVRHSVEENNINIKWASGADRDIVSDYSIQLILSAMAQNQIIKARIINIKTILNLNNKNSIIDENENNESDNEENENNNDHNEKDEVEENNNKYENKFLQIQLAINPNRNNNINNEDGNEKEDIPMHFINPR